MTHKRERQSELQARYDSYIDAGLKLDLTRGKPAAEQLDLSNELTASSEDSICFRTVPTSEIMAGFWAFRKLDN